MPIISDTTGILYLFIYNEMHIAATGIPGGHLEVSISNGEIIDKGDVYVAKPEKTGTAQIKVKAINQTGEINEEDSIVYKVEYPPLPELILPGMIGNTISKRNLPGRNTIELKTYVHENPYTLQEFSLSLERDEIFGAISNGLYLTQQQIDLILSKPSGDKIYITNAKFRDPYGKIHSAPVKEIWIED